MLHGSGVRRALLALVTLALAACAAEAPSDEIPALDETTSARSTSGGSTGIVPQPFTVPNAFTSTGAGATHTTFTSKVNTWLPGWASGTSWIIPIPDGEAGYPATPLPARIYWKPAVNLSTTVLSDINLHSDVYVNDVRVGQAHWSSLFEYIWADVSIPVKTYMNVRFRVTSGLGTYESGVNSLFEMPVSPFVLLLKTFRAPACTKCHTMGDSASISSYHVAKGAWGAPNPSAQPDDPSVCNGCHAQFVGNDVWMSPSFGKNMNFATMPTAKQICQAATANSGTADAFSLHMEGSMRVGWAIFDGRLPNGKLETLAPPADFLAADELTDQFTEYWTYTYDPCAGLEWVP